MSNPTEAQIIAQWQGAVDILEETRKYGQVNAKNFLGMLDTLETSYRGDFLDDAEDAAQAIRSALAGIVSSDVAQRILTPFLKQYMKSVVGLTDLSNISQMWDELYLYYATNAKRVQSRVFTFGAAVAGGSNIGNGQILRLTKDQYNYDIESAFIDRKRVKCVLDSNTGTDPGAEVFQIAGQAKGRDDLERSGSGQEAVLVAKTADDSLLNNASFSSFGNTAAAPDSIDGWTSSGGNSSSVYIFDSTNYFRAAPSDGATSYAIKLVASTILGQKLTISGAELDPNIPYLLMVAWNRSVYSATGTLNLRLGNTTTTVTLAAQTGWNMTTVPNPIGQSCWYKQFAQQDLEIQIEFIRTGGSLLVDDVLLLPGTFYPADNHWYWAIPSSASSFIPYRVNDQFTLTDIATDSKIQKWNWRAFNRYLPHSNGSSITFADP